MHYEGVSLGALKAELEQPEEEITSLCGASFHDAGPGLRVPAELRAQFASAGAGAQQSDERTADASHVDPAEAEAAAVRA